MFERFTTTARDAVVTAQVEARELDAPRIGTEHLLLGLLASDDGTTAATILRGAGVSPDGARSEIRAVLAEHGADEADDAAALRAIGIDLDEVRERVERSFGPGALDDRRGRRSRRRHQPRFLDHVPFSPRAKKVLELSLREALRLKHHWIGPEHILLGLLREGEGLATLVLTRHRIDLQHLRQQVVDALADAA